MPSQNWRAALESMVDFAIDPSYVAGVQGAWAHLAVAPLEQVAAKIFEVANFQGMSDRAAVSWLSTNGLPDFSVLTERLRHEACPHAASLEGITACGFVKRRNSCNNPSMLASCLVPHIPARKGQLTRLAVALAYWVEDWPERSLRGWVNAQSRAGADTFAGQAMVDDLKRLPGLSDKVASMIASDIAIGLSVRRPALLASGASIVVIDSLVHNLLMRTGAITSAGKPHAFGSGCYASGGCSDLIVRFSETVDARSYNSAWPRLAPRMLQHALWRFCAGNEFNVCNGNQIHAGRKCESECCPAARRCARVILYKT